MNRTDLRALSYKEFGSLLETLTKNVVSACQERALRVDMRTWGQTPISSTNSESVPQISAAPVRTGEMPDRGRSFTLGN